MHGGASTLSGNVVPRHVEFYKYKLLKTVKLLSHSILLEVGESYPERVMAKLVTGINKYHSFSLTCTLASRPHETCDCTC